jgi:hypothetical protein
MTRRQEVAGFTPWQAKEEPPQVASGAHATSISQKKPWLDQGQWHGTKATLGTMEAYGLAGVREEVLRFFYPPTSDAMSDYKLNL